MESPSSFVLIRQQSVHRGKGERYFGKMPEAISQDIAAKLVMQLWGRINENDATSWAKERLEWIRPCWACRFGSETSEKLAHLSVKELQETYAQLLTGVALVPGRDFPPEFSIEDRMLATVHAWLTQKDIVAPLNMAEIALLASLLGYENKLIPILQTLSSLENGDMPLFEEQKDISESLRRKLLAAMR